MNVLVVDDSGIMRKVLIRELLKMGFVENLIDQAEDGMQAVKAVTEKQYDLILMDWNMPNMLGIDAVKTMRANGIQTPILMVTTESERTNVVLAIQAGATNYLVKPFNEESFQGKINQVFPDLATKLSV